MQISIIGGGAWGSSLAVALSPLFEVILVVRKSTQMHEINTTSTNGIYLPATVKFSHRVTATLDFSATQSSDLIIIATPTDGLRAVATQIISLFGDKAPDIIWVCKGFEHDTSLLPHQIIYSIMPQITNVGGLLGPSFAQEVALGKPTALTLTSHDTNFALKWLNIIQHQTNLRLYINQDVIGSEIGAGVKNIIAIAVGIADGLELGYNARAALITRGLSEISKLIHILGGEVQTLYGLSGVGDLLLTCTSDLSRNRRVGLMLAQGKDIQQILVDLQHVAEGVSATKEIYNLNKTLHIDMPIIDAVYQIIYQQGNINTIINNLLRRPQKMEF